MITLTKVQKMQKIYSQGCNAFYDGGKLEDNPYYRGDGESLRMWNIGYHDAMDNVHKHANDYLDENENVI